MNTLVEYAQSLVRDRCLSPDSHGAARAVVFLSQGVVHVRSLVRTIIEDVIEPPETNLSIDTNAWLKQLDDFFHGLPLNREKVETIAWLTRRCISLGKGEDLAFFTGVKGSPNLDILAILKLEDPKFRDHSTQSSTTHSPVFPLPPTRSYPSLPPSPPSPNKGPGYKLQPKKKSP